MKNLFTILFLLNISHLYSQTFKALGVEMEVLDCPKTEKSPRNAVSFGNDQDFEYYLKVNGGVLYDYRTNVSVDIYKLDELGKVVEQTEIFISKKIEFFMEPILHLSKTGLQLLYAIDNKENNRFELKLVDLERDLSYSSPKTIHSINYGKESVFFTTSLLKPKTNRTDEAALAILNPLKGRVDLVLVNSNGEIAMEAFYPALKGLPYIKYSSIRIDDTNVSGIAYYDKSSNSSKPEKLVYFHFNRESKEQALIEIPLKENAQLFSPKWAEYDGKVLLVGYLREKNENDDRFESLYTAVFDLSSGEKLSENKKSIPRTKNDSDKPFYTSVYITEELEQNPDKSFTLISYYNWSVSQGSEGMNLETGDILFNHINRNGSISPFKVLPRGDMKRSIESTDVRQIVYKNYGDVIVLLYEAQNEIRVSRYNMDDESLKTETLASKKSIKFSNHRLYNLSSLDDILSRLEKFTVIDKKCYRFSFE